MIRAILFDFDGTVGDTFPLVLKTANDLLLEMGQERITNPESYRSKSAFEILRASGIPFWKLPALRQKAVTRMANEFQETPSFAGMKSILELLRGSYTIGVVTSNDAEPVEAVLRKQKIGVDFLYAGHSIFGKHRVIRACLREQGLLPEEVIYVGDEVRDIDACRKAGVKIISVTWGFNSKQRLAQAKPDAIVDTPSQLVQKIRQMAKN